MTWRELRRRDDPSPEYVAVREALFHRTDTQDHTEEAS